jgi:pimeloyl-ACP methyl ester carboxylesterase
MKTVLFVPGSGEDIDSRDYRATIKAIEAKGYKVVFVDITWPRTIIDRWVKELEDVYSTYDPKQTILAGFSFGAMTALVAASHRAPAELWLFSLSPYFAEDIVSENMNQSWLRRNGHRRVDAFRKVNFKVISTHISCKTLLFYGQLEIEKWPIMKERADGARKYIAGARYIEVDAVGHDVANEIYIRAIVDTI